LKLSQPSFCKEHKFKQHDKNLSLYFKEDSSAASYTYKNKNNDHGKKSRYKLIAGKKAHIKIRIMTKENKMRYKLVPEKKKALSSLVQHFPPAKPAS
jgi:hypothetical protein